MGEMPSAGAPGTGVGSMFYTLLTVLALAHKTVIRVRQSFRPNPGPVAIPPWLLKQDDPHWKTITANLDPERKTILSN